MAVKRRQLRERALQRGLTPINSRRKTNQAIKECFLSENYTGLVIFLFFSIWVFFRKHSRFTGQQEKEEAISLSPLYHFHSLHIHLDISRPITVESSPLHIASSRTQTGNLWFPSASL